MRNAKIDCVEPRNSGKFTASCKFYNFKLSSIVEKLSGFADMFEFNMPYVTFCLKGKGNKAFFKY